MRAAPSELIDAARSGDTRALDELLRICRPNLRRYALRTCANEDIEDAVQDALLILYRRVGALRVLAAFSSWIFQIVKRECLRRLKGRLKERDACSAIADVSDRTDPELRLDLIRTIGALPPIYRDVLLLRDVG